MSVYGEGQHGEDAGCHGQVGGEAHHLAVGSSEQPNPAEHRVGISKRKRYISSALFDSFCKVLM